MKLSPYTSDNNTKRTMSVMSYIFTHTGSMFDNEIIIMFVYPHYKLTAIMGK